MNLYRGCGGNEFATFTAHRRRNIKSLPSASNPVLAVHTTEKSYRGAVLTKMNSTQGLKRKSRDEEDGSKKTTPRLHEITSADSIASRILSRKKIIPKPHKPKEPGKTIGLLALPAELRNQIYTSVIKDAFVSPIGLRHIKQPAVTRVCKQTRSETMGMLVDSLRQKEWRVPVFAIAIPKSPAGQRELSRHQAPSYKWHSVAPWLVELEQKSETCVKMCKDVTFYVEVVGGPNI